MTRTLPHTEIVAFRKKVYSRYKKYGRKLPWRETHDPYHILVSEIMLQQTQVDRVVTKYTEFLKAFPTIKALAAAPFKKVLQVWQGLGYNRRALFLKQTAEVVVERYKGKLPASEELLDELPGIGRATASAVCAYAFKMPVVYIETNIRAIFIHTFFPKKRKVSDDELVPLVAQTLDKKDPHRWYNALMDYGTMLKEEHANPARKSKHHVKQSRFEGSDRQIRGEILRMLAGTSKIKKVDVLKKFPGEELRVGKILNKLLTEKMISKAGGVFFI